MYIFNKRKCVTVNAFIATAGRPFNTMTIVCRCFRQFEFHFGFDIGCRGGRVGSWQLAAGLGAFRAQDATEQEPRQMAH